MTDDDEFGRILENLQRILKLNAQYENHLYVEEFTKECSVIFLYRTYVVEGEADAKFSLGKLWNLLLAGSLPNNASNFFRQMINCMRAWNYIQKTSRSSMSFETITQTQKIMMENEKHRDGKMSWWGNIESRLHLQTIIFLHQLASFKDIWKAQFLGSTKLKAKIQLRPLQICLEVLSIYIHLKMVMEEFVA